MSVWGDEYTRFFISFVLPSLFSKNNIPYSSKRRKVFFDIFTTKTSKERILCALKINKIYKCAEFNFHIINAKMSSNKYSLMTRMNNISLKKARRRNSLISFLSPDAILADGGFRTIENALKNGFRAVCCIAPCANKISAEADLKKFLNKSLFKISPRELARIWFDHKNNLAASHYVDKKIGLLISPSYFYFSIDKYNMIARQFHLHPILVDPNKSKKLIIGTFDLFFVEEAIKDFSKVKIVTDSDDLNYVEFSSNFLKKSQINEENLYNSFAFFIQQSAKDFNLKNIWVSIYYHATKKRKRDHIIKKSDQFIKNLLCSALQNIQKTNINLISTQDVYVTLFSYIKRKVHYWINFKNVEYKRFWAILFKIFKNIQFNLFSLCENFCYKLPGHETFDFVFKIDAEKMDQLKIPNRVFFDKKVLIIYKKTSDLKNFIEVNKDKIGHFSSKVLFYKDQNS